MKILFIGGTKFVGRNIAELALTQGHDIHILQRGNTNSNIFPTAKKYIGDRTNISEILPDNETFDLVVDTCGYHPAVVEKSAFYLKGKTKKYTFISTGSVYSDFAQIGLSEESEVQTSEIVPNTDIKITGENYGLLKSQCEDVIRKYYSDNEFLILRPCIIVGKYDDTNRFNFWLDKIRNCNELEVPNDKNAYIQFIDVRAIADFVLKSEHKSGIYNLIGPSHEITFFDFIELNKNILNPNIRIKLIDPLAAELPMYVADSNWNGFFKFDGSKAYNHGLAKYTAEETIRYVASELGYL